MNAGFFVKKWIEKLFKRYGKNGTIAQLSAYVGAGVAKKVVETLVKAGVTKAVAALGGKIGALAGPAGAALGLVVGLA